VKSFIGRIATATAELENLLPRLPKPEAAKLVELQRDLHDTKERFSDLLKLTASISVRRKAEPIALALSLRLKKALECFDLIVKTYGIEIAPPRVADSIKVGPMLEAELYAVLLNVLSNAIKAVIAGSGVRKILIEAERADQAVVVRICDTGIGLAESRFQDVFTPFVADPDGMLYPALEAALNPADEYIIGTGSGLGLSIVNEIVTSRGGNVRFVKPATPWRTILEIRLP
jgi:signal transduction histidine kinase